MSCATLSVRASVVITSLAIVSGCGTYHNTISTVPSNFPRDQVATLQCFSPCNTIFNDRGNVVIKQSPIHLTHGIIGKIELIPGNYSIKALECDGYFPYSSNTFTTIQFEAQAGKSYYLTHEFDNSSLKGGCYTGLNISGSDIAIDERGARR